MDFWRMLRPLLFSLDPENAHKFAILTMRAAGVMGIKHLLKKINRVPEKPVELWGLKFRNPVGLAAGWDKNGQALHGLSALGFGHIEVGTITPLPQDGRSRPRVFRLPEDESIINRMGFPNKGEDYLKDRLFFRPYDTIVGVNLGKNKETPNEIALLDYGSMLLNFSTSADYLVINVSSPNTEGLRSLQERNALEKLLSDLIFLRKSLITPRKNIPLLVKLSPDLDSRELENAVFAILSAGCDGIITTNTTLDRCGLVSPLAHEVGGASGKILTEKSRDALKQVVTITEGRIPIVSVGGIMDADEAKRRLDMGASLVQLYTGFIYKGPRLIREIVELL